jgi:hypothetical protein
MSNKTSILLKAFNKHFFEFLDDIISIFPDKKEIATSKEYLETLKTANPTALIKIWYTYIFEPYKTEIGNGNIDFFLEKDYSQDISTIQNSEKILNIIDSSLREPLKQMDQENKEKCIKYIQLLSTVSEKYTELKM